jgi:hypothetical protein
MKFEDLKFKELYDGKQAIVDFGEHICSIVSHSGSYGGKDGLYEIGMDCELPGITIANDTVKGYLTEADVSAILTKLVSITGNEGVQVSEFKTVSIND